MSILNVDKIQPIGSGSTVTVNATDTILTNAQAGVITATRFDGIISATTDDWITHHSDSNTRMGFPATDTFAVETGGDERLRIGSNGRILIGHDTNSSDLHGSQGTTNRNPFFQIHGANNSSAGAALISWHGGGGAYYSPVLYLARSGSATKGTNGIIPSGQTFGSIVFNGDDGTDFVKGAMITAELDGTPGDNDMPGRLEFHTTPDGAQEPEERLRITSTGLIQAKTRSAEVRRMILAGSPSNSAFNIEAHDGETGTSSGDVQGKLGLFYNDGSTLTNTACISFERGSSASDGAMTFVTNQAERLRITSAGKVGIGTINPSGSLGVWDASGSDPTMSLHHSNADVEGEIIRIGRTDIPTIRYHSIKARHGGAATANFIKFHLHNGSSTTSQSELLRLEGNGNVTIPDGNLVVASGHGIDFSATGDSSVGANINERFDDYERGRFTPKIYYGTGTDEPTYSWRYAHYIKVGKQVTVWFNLGITGFNPNPDVNNVYLANLPFQNNDPDSQWKYLNLMYGYSWASGWGFNSGSNNLMFLSIYDNESKARIVKHDGAHLSTADIGSGQRWSSTFSYQTDS